MTTLLHLMAEEGAAEVVIAVDQFRLPGPAENQALGVDIAMALTGSKIGGRLIEAVEVRSTDNPTREELLVQRVYLQPQ